ncbi:YY1-associated factor 2-like [Bolinopsis microptera]|uniref:YY1-associated factor 2-like n=1 Tax=Bolinopsis microptera TaxID=2820187 RepID=UPI003079218B
MVEDKESPPPIENEPEIVPTRQTRRSQAGNHSNGNSSNGNNPATSSNGDLVGSWECSVCTYKNIEEEFKCAMCETRKGTSTRKPRATSQTQVVQIQALAAELVAKQTNALLRKQRRRHLRQQRSVIGQSATNFTRPGRLKNVDRSKGTKINVTVNNVTVVITDFPEIKSPKSRSSPCEPDKSSAASSTPSPAPSAGDNE